MRPIEHLRHRRVRIARPFPRGEARVEIRFLGVLAVDTWLPERQELRQVLDGAQRLPVLRLQLGEVLRALRQHAETGALHLADPERVAGRQQSPGGRLCRFVGFGADAGVPWINLYAT